MVNWSPIDYLDSSYEWPESQFNSMIFLMSSIYESWYKYDNRSDYVIQGSWLKQLL